jgi:F0F1-type ATP synthase membrane subunit b/b'
MTPPNLSLVLIMICFWCTMWLVHRFLIKPVGAVLEERQGGIGQATQSWEATHQEYLAATTRLELEIQNAAREAARVRGSTGGARPSPGDPGSGAGGPMTSGRR